MQDQPVVRIAPERLRDDPVEPGLDLVRSLARRQAGPIAHPEHVRVDRKRLFSEGRVEHDVRRLAPDAGQRLQLLAGARDFTAILIDQRAAERDYVLRLGVKQSDCLDCLSQPVLAQRDHLLGGTDMLEQGPGRDIDARVRRLRREHDGDEKRVRVRVLELGRRRGVVLGQPAEEFENLVLLHSASMTSRIE
jgi:hypothetical protein